MTFDNKPKSDTQITPSSERLTSAPAADPQAQFENWLTADLESLVEKFADWHTTSSNRKYFGR